MLSKLLSFLAQAKGAAIATVVVASAATATVGATSPEVQDTFNNITAAITGSSPAPRAATTDASSSDTSCTDEAGAGSGSGGGQPVVVAQRNASEKLLRDAYTADHKKLQDLRGGAGQDNKTVGDIVRTYDQQLQDTLDIALNRVAALTLGREGQVRADASATARATASPVRPEPSGSPRPSESARPSCSPRPSGSAHVASASESPRASGSARPSDQGRVAVADRTTLQPDIKAIVDQAITDMDALVKKATDAVTNASPSPDHGKPSDNPGNKPEGSGAPGNGGGKPSDNPGGGNKPSNSPGRP